MALVRHFWEQEELTRPVLPLSAEDCRCEVHYIRLHYRDPSGHYVMRLPIRVEMPDLSSTRRSASRMLDTMEWRFQQDGDFRERYEAFMRECLMLGHMSPARPSPAGDDRHLCYLPHHGILKGAARRRSASYSMGRRVPLWRRP